MSLTIDSWVYSVELPASQRAGHSYYDPSKSVTARNLNGYTWGISYGDGSSASGDVYIETVKIGATTVTNQAVELASTISNQFQQDVDNDGLVGLSFDVGNTVRPARQKTFFSNAKPTLSAPLFTVNLKKGAPGSYDFGFIDSSKYTGAITYVPVNQANGFWEFTSNGYAVGSGAFTSGSIDSIADTGTTLLYLPSTVVSAYYAKVPGASYNSGQGGYTFPCSATLPSITLGIGSYRAVVPGSYIVYAPVSSTSKLWLHLNPYQRLWLIFLQLALVAFNATPALAFLSLAISFSSRNLWSSAVRPPLSSASPRRRHDLHRYSAAGRPNYTG